MLRDEFQPSLLAHRTQERIVPGERQVALVPAHLVVSLDGFGFRRAEQVTATLDIPRPKAVGVQAVMPDARKALGENVHQEAPDKFGRRKSHDALFPFLFVILVPEGNLAVFHCDQALIGEGRAMSVPGQVVERRLRPAEGRFGVDMPFHPTVRFDEPIESFRAGEFPGLSGKTQFARFIGPFERLQKQSPEETLQNVHMQKEVLAASHPAFAVGRNPASGDDHMDVGMMQQGAAPGMQHAGEADVRAQMPGIPGDREHGFRRGLEEDVVDHAPVDQRQILYLFRDGEDDVKVRYGQELGSASGQPRGRGQSAAFGAGAIAA